MSWIAGVGMDLFEDAERLLSFIEETYRDRVPKSGGLLPRASAADPAKTARC